MIRAHNAKETIAKRNKKDICYLKRITNNYERDI